MLPVRTLFISSLLTVIPFTFTWAQPSRLNVVELFQSQGCSSCPPANANVMMLSDRPDVLTLSFAVTYWDHLGWKDTFASPHFTERQRAYAHAFHRSEVFTPEVVVNGRADTVGQDLHEVEALIAEQANRDSGPAIELKDSSVTVGDGRGNARVLLVRYNPRILQVAVTAGENEGRTLPHKDVVRELIDLGSWSGHTETYAIPPATEAGLNAAILLQGAEGGPIISAVRN